MATIPQFASRPDVEVIVYRHKPGCKFTAPDKIGRCSCRKHLYVREARLRIATGNRSWDAAREFASRWQDAHDPLKIKQRESFRHGVSHRKGAAGRPEGGQGA